MRPLGWVAQWYLNPGPQDGLWDWEARVRNISLMSTDILSFQKRPSVAHAALKGAGIIRFSALSVLIVAKTTVAFEANKRRYEWQFRTRSVTQRLTFSQTFVYYSTDNIRSVRFVKDLTFLATRHLERITSECTNKPPAFRMSSSWFRFYITIHFYNRFRF